MECDICQEPCEDKAGCEYGPSLANLAPFVDVEHLSPQEGPFMMLLGAGVWNVREHVTA